MDVTARQTSNAAILGKTLRRMRRDGRLDDVAEVLAVLAGTSARLVDDACAPGSPAPAYAQAQALRVHAAVVAELAGRVSPMSTGELDPFEQIARELSATPDQWPNGGV